jgi:hypothetical protein
MCDFVRSKLLPLYAVGQAAVIMAFVFVPSDSWMTALWHVATGWTAAVCLVVGARRFRPEAAAAWYLFSTGVFLDATGLLVETIGERWFGITSTPGPADIFYLGRYPGLIVGLGLFVYRRSAREDFEATMLRTAACALLTMFLGIFAWEFIIWQTSDQRLSLAKRLMVTAYPLADLVVIALMLRLLFGGAAARNPAFVLVVLALFCFLGADIGWAIYLRAGTEPTAIVRRLLEIGSMSAYALMGGAALHPAIQEIAPPYDGHRLHAVGWAALVVSILTAPTVLLVQAILDHFYLVPNL